MTPPSDLDPEKLRRKPQEIRPVAQSRARVLPTVYQHVLKTDWFRRWTFIERLKILFGYNFNVLIRVRCKHNPGDCDPIIAGEVTPFTVPSELLRHRIESDIAKLQAGQQPQVENEL